MSCGCYDVLMDTGTEQVYGNRVEPKVYLANERTFLEWLSMSVTLGSIASVCAASLACPVRCSHSQTFARLPHA